MLGKVEESMKKERRERNKTSSFFLLHLQIFFRSKYFIKLLGIGAGLVVQWLSTHVLLLGGLGFTGSDPGYGHGIAWQKPCCGSHPAYKAEEDGHGC